MEFFPGIYDSLILVEPGQLISALVEFGVGLFLLLIVILVVIHSLPIEWVVTLGLL